jgi:hypothetical protein
MLDWIYIFLIPQGRAATHIKEYHILGDCVLSDHLPVTYEVELIQEKQSGGRYLINCAYLLDLKVIAALYS